MAQKLRRVKRRAKVTGKVTRAKAKVAGKRARAGSLVSPARKAKAKTKIRKALADL